MNSKERRDRLVQFLAIRGKTSTKILAEKLEVSQRTVLRDIDILSRNNPIGVEYGRGGGYYISNYKSLNLPCMKEHEIRLLKKIVSETQNNASCTLDPSEHQLLEEIITLYSKDSPAHLQKSVRKKRNTQSRDADGSEFEKTKNFMKS